MQLTYHQTRSDRSDPLARQCRGLILRTSDWAPVCWGMDRFFNHHEADTSAVVPPLRVEEKEDGTYLLLFHDGVRWAAATRHTFCAHDRRYLSLLLDATGHGNLDALAAATGLRPGVTYCLELCGPDNRIIRPYAAPAVFLLAAYPLDTHAPLSHAALDTIAAGSGGALRRPAHTTCDSLKAVHALLEDATTQQRLFEGYVALDQRGVRLKVKNPLHQRFEVYKYNSWAMATPKNLLPYVLRDGGAWLLEALRGLIPEADRAEYALRLDALDTRIDEEVSALLALRAALAGQPRAAVAAALRDSTVAAAPMLMSAWDRFPEAPDEARAHLAQNPARLLRLLFPGTAARNVLTGVIGEHGPEYCPPPDQPPPGVARPPVRTSEGWQVWCACGTEMALLRMPIDRVRYRRCHCGEAFGLHVYRAGVLLWVCPDCDATHEAHQQDEAWPDEGIPYQKGQPLGVPASPACKALRLQVHRRMGALREARGLDKAQGYRWLAAELGLSRAEAHVALFDAPRCAGVIRRIDVLLKEDE